MKNEIRDTCVKKDDQIERLENKVITLTNKVDLLDEKLDEQEAYERTDIIILSGKNIPPPSSPNENCSTLVCSLLPVEHRIKNPLRRTSRHIAIIYFQTFL